MVAGVDDKRSLSVAAKRRGVGTERGVWGLVMVGYLCFRTGGTPVVGL